MTIGIFQKAPTHPEHDWQYAYVPDSDIPLVQRGYTKSDGIVYWCTPRPPGDATILGDFILAEPVAPFIKLLGDGKDVTSNANNITGLWFDWDNNVFYKNQKPVSQLKFRQTLNFFGLSWGTSKTQAFFAKSPEEKLPELKELRAKLAEWKKLQDQQTVSLKSMLEDLAPKKQPVSAYAWVMKNGVVTRNIPIKSENPAKDLPPITVTYVFDDKISPKTLWNDDFIIQSKPEGGVV